MNVGKCKMRLFRARWRGTLLTWYCARADHDHGPKRLPSSKVTAESIVIPAETFYAQMVKR